MLPTRRSTFKVSAALFVAVVMLVSGLAAMSHVSGPAAPATVAPSAAPAAVPAASTTHGDLVVVAGETYYINSSHGAQVYFQAGNITVESGGTLIIKNVTLSFVQFVGSTGSPVVRLAHIVRFIDESGGVVKVSNAVITTDMFEINAYAKLNLTVEGTMDLWNSTIAFPGWVNVEGAGATLTLNGSHITRNPAVIDHPEPAVIQGDEDFAPTLAASAGGVVNLFNSSFSATYGDNFSQNGTPHPVPMGVKNVTLVPGSFVNLTALKTPNDSASLAQDWLYPMGIAGGEVVVFYNNSENSITTANVVAWYDGQSYALGTLTVLNGTENGNVSLKFPAALTHAINSGGLLNYLNSTGDFGVTPSRIAINITGIANNHGDVVNASGVYFVLNPPVSYDISATGAGTHINTVDTSLDLTFNALGAGPLSTRLPYPWLANKVNLSAGANASLANLSVPNTVPGVFETSAILADASSEAYLFRWAQINLTGLGGALPVYGGHVAAYYAYNTNQTNNATANAANDLKTWDTPIWQYLQYWDEQHALPAYATSGFGGNASLLLASNEITGSTLPDGIFMGGYHLVVVIPVAADNTHTFNASVSPYPAGVAFGTPGYGLPDFAHPQNFPSYFAGVGVTSAHQTVGGVVEANTTVRIGEAFGALVTVTDTGTAPVFSLAPSLFWNVSTPTLLTSSNLTVNLTAPGQTATFGLNWTVVDTVTGLHGTFNNTFDLQVVWNLGEPKFGGGTLPVALNNTTVEPSLIKISAVTTTPVPASPLNIHLSYVTDGTVAFNTSLPKTVGEASITLYATPVGGGTAIVLGDATHAPGTFQLSWFYIPGRLANGTSYDLTLVASWNRQSFTDNLGVFAIPAAPSPSHNFLTQKFLGLPLWIWIAIAAAVVIGLVAFFMVARRQAAGKVVECGECGNLVPENAPTCPKCGAEFESELVRCSRCASTIPANSQFCPECAAQLLGKPGEGGRDPERDGYADFTERFRAEAKKELGENYTEGSFWDWWKRQPTYTSFSQWKLQQDQGAPRGGMMAPPIRTTEQPAPTPPKVPPKGGAPPAAAAAPGDRGPPPARRPRTDQAPPAAAPTTAATAPGGLKPCPNCRKEIPPEYLVCPFCGSVTQ